MYDGLLKSNVDKEGKSTLHPEIQEHLKFGVGLFYVRKKEKKKLTKLNQFSILLVLYLD